jgi:hypothetical protein
MPFAGDLPDNNFAAYKAEMVRWILLFPSAAKVFIKPGRSSGEFLDGHA